MKREQKPRLGEPNQPNPERWAYVEKARAARATRGAWELSAGEVQQARAMARSGAVVFTIAAYFGISRKETKAMTHPPCKLRSEVPRPFETPADAQARELWMRDELVSAHADAWKHEIHLACYEAHKEDKARAKERRRVEKAAAKRGKR